MMGEESGGHEAWWAVRSPAWMANDAFRAVGAGEVRRAFVEGEEEGVVASREAREKVVRGGGARVGVYETEMRGHAMASKEVRTQRGWVEEERRKREAKP
eukprot:1277924-Rhodomonas_salina.1